MALAVYAAEGETSVAGTPLRVIPIPVNIELEQGVFIVPEQGMTCYIEGERAEQLTGYLEQGPLKWIPVEKAGKADVVIKLLTGNHARGKRRTTGRRKDIPYRLLRNGLRYGLPERPVPSMPYRPSCK